MNKFVMHVALILAALIVAAALLFVGGGLISSLVHIFENAAKSFGIGG